MFIEVNMGTLLVILILVFTLFFVFTKVGRAFMTMGLMLILTGLPIITGFGILGFLLLKGIK